VAHVSHVLPDGRQLLDDASCKIPDEATAAIVGHGQPPKPVIPNGSGLLPQACHCSSDHEKGISGICIFTALA
jgi:hypothetical protein